jgi:hypothetical protein
MGRKTATNRRVQSQRGREVSLNVRRTQGLRFSNASGPHLSGPRYSRSAEREALLSGRYDDLLDY